MKLLILGLSCSGKTTISNHLSKILKIPCYHLDSYYWESCWIKNAKFDINEIINLKDWIIDGNYYKEEFIR
ncbi:MAG: AAA family ATPase, partial [Clostridia bacterium]|nr:AAA family ATPase [Clostridia bacterium]